MILFIKIKDLTNLPISFPNNEAAMFKISGNTDEIIEKIMDNSIDPAFKEMHINNGTIIDGIIRYNTILSFVKGKIDYKGKNIDEFSKEEWSSFYDYIFNVKFENTDTTHLYSELNS